MICPSVASLMPSARISLRAAKHTFASIGVRPCVPLHASRMLYGTVPGMGAFTHVCRGPPRSHFRPFSTEDELELSSVLMTRPRHVARHIRQSMLGSSRRIARFRSSVTYLMIVLQSRLQRKECAPHEASLIMENLMKECVDLRQGDMAHLLFRASIRFRKYGMKVGMPLVKSLYDSYRIDNAKELMKNLAEELKNNIEETELAIIAVLAYEFSGQHNHALELLKKIPQSKLSTSDVCSIIEGFGMGAHYDDVCMITEELLKEENKVESSDLSAIVSSAVCATIGNQEHMNKMVECAMRRGIRLSEQAASTLLRIALEEAKPTTVSEVYDVENGLCKRLGVDNLGTASETSVIAKCTELLHKSHESGDDIMLCKVQHLAQVVDNAMDNDQLDDIDPVYIVSMIKGFGVLGRFEEMKSSFVKLKKCGGVKDHRLYDEMLKWYAHSYNVKEVIALKEEMTADNVYHTPFTYHNVFRVLDKYYPRMVEKYVKEMRGRGIALEGFMYPTLMRVFMELKDYETVDNLYREARSRGQQGLGPSFTPGIVIQALRCYQHDLDRCRGIIEDADKRGFLAHEAVQAEILQLYASNERYEELGRLLTRIPNKSSSIYRVLLRDATKRRDRKEFDKLLNEVMSQHVELNERLFSVIITSLGFFKDAEGVNKFIAMARSSEQIRSPMFFSDAAGAFARLGHLPAVDQCWKDLLQSHMAITMPVYNRFLDIYMNHNNVVMVQEILDTMMKLVPPNPVTATTVVDMLGKMGRLSEMEAVLSEMSKSTNASPTLVTYHQAMNAYAKCGDVVKMEQMRERLQREGFVENNVTYNILFEGYGRAKRFEHLAELLQQRKERGIAMDEFGYVILLNTYARARLTSEAEAIVDEMVTSGINFTCRMMATVANAFSAVGNVEQMERYIRLLLAHPECRLREVESVYSIYSRQRDTVKLQELLDTKTLPKSEFIFNICVAAFARAGEHTKVAFLLHEMEQKGYSLSRNTSVILSTLLLKAGKVELANSVLKWKGVQPEQVETPEDGRSLDEDSLPLTSEECLQQQMESSIPSTHKGEDDGIKMD